ncbi:MAG: type II secretion system GspH family protein [Gallionella sp.]|nr:type II secretion system GspH family protein [Gallionella sp.]
MSKQVGFTLVEMITVMIVLGILSAVALPRIMDNRAFIGAAFHADVVSALRYAQKSAISHRRLVCATLTATTVTLSIAVLNPASTCATALPSPDGAPYQSKDGSIQASAIPVPIGGILYFQPSGTITFDGAGVNLYSLGKITITGRATTPIKIEGATGYVE